MQIREALVELNLAPAHTREFLDSIIERRRRRRRLDARKINWNDNVVKDPAAKVNLLVSSVVREENLKHEFYRNQICITNSSHLCSDDKLRVLCWILASTYPQNIVTARVPTLFNDPLMITYTSRKSNVHYGRRRQRKKTLQ